LFSKKIEGVILEIVINVILIKFSSSTENVFAYDP